MASILDESNATIVDAIRLKSSNDYQQRVPEVDAVGLERVKEVLESDLSLMNEFHERAVNLIGSQLLHDYDFNNPLARFKQANLKMGQNIEELAVGLLKANGYNMKDNNVFKRNPAEVYAKIHKLNRRARYDLTINPTVVAQAMLQEGELTKLIARELAVPGISDEHDEYQVMKQLIAISYAKGELFKYNTPFQDSLVPTNAELKRLSVAIRSVAEKLKFITTTYSAEGVPTVSKPENLVLITTPEVKANLDVEVLADAFHIDRTDFAREMVIIDEFPMDGVHAMLVDKNWFVAGDYIRETTSFYNAKSLETNFYLHHWGLYSTSPYVNAIIFGDFEGDAVPVITVTIDSLDATVVDENGDAVTTFSYGDDLTLEVITGATVVPENKVVVAPKGWFAEISLATGAGVAIAKNYHTSYTENGDLRVQDGLKAGDKITIKVTSTYIDPNGIIDPETGDIEDAPAPLTDTVVLTVA